MDTLSPVAEPRLARSLNEEPRLDDMLADPVVQLMMLSDGLHAAEIRRVLARARERRGRVVPAVSSALCGAAGCCGA